MEQDFRILAEALGSSLKQTCRNKGLNVEMAASRHVGDRILFHWRAGFGGAVMMVKGGCMFDQHLRPTSDLDLVTPVRWTEDELRKGFARIAEALRAEGISIDQIKVKELAVGEGDPVVRVVIQGKCGTLRGNTHVDISSVSGPFAFPQDVQRQELPSLLPKRFPGAVAHAQPLAAAAAEKWLAVLTQRDDDFRAKHALDLLSFDEMGVRPGDIAVELLRTLRHRRLPLSTCAPAPKALEWVSYLLRADSWVKTVAQRGIDDFDLLQSYEMLGGYWARTHQALTRAVIAQVRRDNVSEPSLVDRLAARQRQNAPAYRPQQPTP
ncbi:nucleotidyl transferase AbiEii/AbiGii toxin family protein [Rhizobium leguminosarum]|uniref:nucleotidyl transferase AbiEii/AbiGii toxin family protein n=1 Tax=Rhizobium leguminosarum TaxID=384 RepID=UPI001C96A735|nr:nucleotidyl transferase AbiEii/AbiGii toxin family protein [Rhizobium leguminosarum]MBY5775188.1 nucleotidyl transferase AbiEii/AbiGii toxin family protein [Rhizobium leguminosarum]